ncbi:hypothetical protein [Leptospira noguchii]|uniref:hypothetical protein n=1 Tax=Leptospira noguchii TaxID=28182 RepID=UPI0012F6F7F9|nr:hypothetical protein [Leptospira noguchii]
MSISRSDSSVCKQSRHFLTIVRMFFCKLSLDMALIHYRIQSDFSQGIHAAPLAASLGAV